MKDDTRRIRDIIEYALLAVTASISIIIAVLDLVGVLDASSWVSQRIPALTLLAVGFVASYLIIERRGKLDELATSVDVHSGELREAIDISFSQTVRALDGVEVRSFSDGASFVSHFIDRVQKAKRVDDITWGEDAPPTSGKESEVYQRYQRLVNEVSRKPNVIWREIVVFAHASRYQRIRQRIEANILGYNVAHYPRLSEKSPPRITFAIVDREEVFLSNFPTGISVRHPDIVKLFVQYYEQLWNRAEKLKVGNQVNMKALEAIEASLKDLIDY